MTPAHDLDTDSPATAGAQLRESLDEIRLSPAGPQVAALFDFDGTLIAGYSASAMAQERMRRREISLADVTRSMSAGLQMGLGRADLGDFMKLTAQSWRGRSHDELEELGERLFADKIADWVYPEARQLVAEHQRRGHTVALTTSATSYQVSAFARDLGISNVLCTELEVKDGILTGELAAPPLWGTGKADAVQKFALRNGIDLTASYFYADGDEDTGLMHLVGKPRPTNPGRRMEQVARRRGWPVQRFTSRGRASAITRIRSAAGWGSVAPFAAASVVLAAAGRERRGAVNRATAGWLDVMFAATGVQVRVSGAEHLKAPRPAVFVFNHRTDFDPLIAASVVREGFVGLVGPEATHDPVTWALARLGDVITVASDGEHAVESFEQAVRLITAKGVSILVAPEVTRPLGNRVSTFDTTAFRVAIEAGVPVIPIVIHNADYLGPRHAKVIRSGTIDISVLPAISVSGWNGDAIFERIQEVRQQFVNALQDTEA